ncbi:MAG: Flp family type IVb pilin [Alphaproteobacteria bacterium]|nr:Flp family type IVb pilin [Alphaproteobacteria bacterium]
MKHILQRFLREETGATAIEYGLIAALISVAIVVVLGEVGTELNNTFTTVKTKLTGGSSS